MKSLCKEGIEIGVGRETLFWQVLSFLSPQNGHFVKLFSNFFFQIFFLLYFSLSWSWSFVCYCSLPAFLLFRPSWKILKAKVISRLVSVDFVFLKITSRIIKGI